jgi:hypothetical protein
LSFADSEKPDPKVLETMTTEHLRKLYMMYQEFIDHYTESRNIVNQIIIHRHNVNMARKYGLDALRKVT